MPYALLSVSDKTGLIEFATELNNLGWTLIASGNTAAYLREHNLAVKDVAEYTQSPEMLGGRVKTLHPAIHGGLLARATEADRNELLQFGWDYIDLVAVNLYPFAATIAKPDITQAEAIEQIDIGGVALIRAAAKNFQRVTLACDPNDYQTILSELKIDNKTTLETRQKLSIKGFLMTSEYDTAIANYFNPESSWNLKLFPQQPLRYGENPHQAATLYAFTPNSGPLGGKLLQGKELSYNNLLDLDAAWKTVVSFTAPTICIVKHLSPCGIASSTQLVDAYQAALKCDPISAFGGIIASNKPFDGATAEALGKLFVECIAAPAFTDEAKAILAKRVNCRLLEISDLTLSPTYELRSINNGILKQDVDRGDPQNTEWKVVTMNQPTATELETLKFAWHCCQHVKSNAIVFVKGTATIGIGSGQPNRIDCVHIGAKRAGDNLNGAMMASDAFFPFADTVESAAQYGIKCIVQPGGSIRDQEVIDMANKLGITMIFTGVRHFRH
ncbi:MAG: bifunctional phosphoribosylaminoimidazolecarboxamide formyltransferase/IMP cyclohydrolase [Gammaproteobacteria bacterium]|nr:bifunctional phosphoribosylaminoimidazolecarboxamide formyltransferase/IMP cyclohydrolase [Gammaproteobacteria bacterium]